MLGFRLRALSAGVPWPIAGEGAMMLTNRYVERRSPFGTPLQNNHINPVFLMVL